MKKALRISFFALLLFSANSTCGQILRAAAEPDYPPFSIITPEGTPDGFSIDLLKAATEAMGRNVTFKTVPRDQIKTEVVNYTLDVLPMMCRTIEREAVYDFTVPYIIQHSALFVREDYDDIQSLSDLPGKRIAVMNGDTVEEYLRRNKLMNNVISTTTFKEAFQMVSSGQADVVIAQKLTGLSMLNEMGIKNVRIVGPPGDELKQTVCFAVRKGRKGLLSLLNDGLAQIYADGTYQQIYRKWMATDRYDALLTKVILVGGNRNNPPYEFLNEQGVPDGFNVELTRAVAESMGLSVQFRLDAWQKVVSDLRAELLDAVIDMPSTPERAAFFDFSTPYITTYCAIYSGPQSPAYSGLSSLRNRRVAVQSARITERNLQQSAPEAIPVPVEEEAEALELLVRNEVDFALVLRPASDWIINNRKLKGLRVEQDDLYHVQSGFAVQKNNTKLIQLIEEGLRRVKANGEYERLRKKWLKIEHVHLLHIIKPYLYWGLVTLLLLILLTSLWINTLNKQVQKRTVALHQSEERFEIAVSAGNIGIWDWDIVHDRMLWDRRMQALYGITPEQLDGTVYDWKKALHPEDLDQAEQAVQNALTGEAGFDTEFRIVRPDGETRYIRAFGNVIRDSNETPLRMIGTNQDITYRKQIEASLKKSESEFRHTINGLQVGVVVHAPDSSIVLSNPHACRFLGLREDEPMKDKNVLHPTWCFVHEDLSVMSIHDYPVNRVIASGEKLLNQVLGIQRPDRTEITWVLVGAVPIFTETNELHAVIVNFMDITARKAAEQALYARNEELARFNKAAVGREMRMIELKNDINELCRSLGRKEPYSTHRSTNTPKGTI